MPFWKHSDAILCCSLKVSLVLRISCCHLHDSLIALPNNSLCQNLKPATVNCLQPAFTLKFANSAGFDILETTVVNIQDLPLEAVLNDEGQKALFAQLPKIMQQVLVLCSYHLWPS